MKYQLRPSTTVKLEYSYINLPRMIRKMQQSESHYPTKEEVLRDLLLFCITHQEDERLFCQGMMKSLVFMVYHHLIQNLHDLAELVRAHPPALLKTLLSEMRNETVRDRSLSRQATLDLHELIDYARHCRE